ncbi:hypothetical protein MARPO_0175s0021, partial [Marchantia polymorpha]
NGGSLGPLVLNSISVEERADRATYEKAEAEKRLLEAEVRVREAIAELHKNQKKKATYSTLFSGRHPLCQHGDSCVANSVGSLCQSFMLAYGVRVGIGVLLRAFKLARKWPYYSFLDLKLLLGENNLIVREEACRTGLLFGGFTGCFHAIRCFLRRKSGTDSPLNVFLASGVAGLSILALDDSQRRRTFALYLLARVAHCAYNSAKAKNKFHFWGSQWQHGDTLLFALACAQIMYAYVMRPETLPDSYNEFILQGGGIDVASLAAFVTSKTGLPMFGVHAHSPIIPCSAVHPDTASCLAHNTTATRATFKKTFPLYLSLTVVPFVVLNIQKFMEAPIHTFWIALKSAVPSTSFLSAFVGVYQGVICVQRKLVTKAIFVHSEVLTREEEMPLGGKADDSDMQETQTVEVVSTEERDQEQEVTVQPQVEENLVNTVVVEEKDFGLDWDEALAVEKLLEESGLEYRVCEDELLDLPQDIADHLRDVQYVQDCLSEEILVLEKFLDSLPKD